MGLCGDGAMFRGLHAVNLDNKGRMTIPARYRAMLEERYEGLLVATIDTAQRCLLLYPFAEWEKIEAKLQALPSFDRASRRIQRLLIGHAAELDIDRQGRILLPALLREYAALGRDVALVGQGNKFEVWGQAQWALAREAWLAEEGVGAGELAKIFEELAL